MTPVEPATGGSALLLRAFLASARLQLTIARRSLDDFALLVLLPVYFAVFAVVLPTSDSDIVARVVLGPGLIGLWMMATFGAGEVLDRERWSGTLGLTVAAPVPLAVLVAGRVLASTLTGVAGLLYVLALAAVTLPESFPVASPGAFGLSLALTAAACVATAPTLACVSVLYRNGDLIRNALTFPVYLVSGVVVPLELLPTPLQVLGRATFLYWGGLALRRSTQGGGLAVEAVSALVVLTVAAAVASAVLLARVDDRARRRSALELA